MQISSGLALLLAGTGLALVSPPARAGQDAEDTQDLSSLSIEELSQIPVRSASKTEEPLSGVANALYVITADDVARSTATSLPEALRLAPNLWVQRTNAREYAISARGMNGIESGNKLLVLVDGRSVYSTLHSGVFWELRSPIPEDLAQIEVISGPGGTLYGPNAVNGVVSIATRDARDTIGLSAHGAAGERERTAGARYGFGLGEQGAMRVYGSWFDREGLPAGAAPDAADGIRGWEAGLRADLNQWMLKAEAFDNRTFQVAGEGNYGQNVTARWNRALDGGSGVQVQAYYDVFHRRSLLTEDFLQTFDAEAQVNLARGPHQIVAGFGGRHTRDRFVNNLNAFRLDPQGRRLWLINGFVQDKFALTPDVAVTAGLKVERSSFSGFQLLPNLRVAWQPNAASTVWAAVSRAVRTPSRIDRELTLPGLLATAPEFRSEKLVAFELGYRTQMGRSTALTVNAFFNGYDDLRSVGLTNGGLPLQLRNDLQGHSYGVEAWAMRQVTGWWRLSAGGAWLGKSFHVRRGATDLSAGAALGADPDYQASLRSQMTLPHGITLDGELRHVDGIGGSAAIPGYTEADLRLGWRAAERVELFVAGENLLHAQHLESSDVQRGQAAVRTVFAGARLRF